MNIPLGKIEGNTLIKSNIDYQWQKIWNSHDKETEYYNIKNRITSKNRIEEISKTTCM